MIDSKPLEQRTCLNVGSGRRYDPEAVNLDLTKDTNPDVVHNLEVFPWPFPEDRFQSVQMRDVIEHLSDTLKTIEELHRICTPGGIIHIVVPHYSSNGAFTDPTHRSFFSALTFDYFTEDHPQNFYTKCRFKRRSLQLVFRPTLLNKIIWRLANRYLQAYENAWAWRFPAWFISVELEVVKHC